MSSGFIARLLGMVPVLVIVAVTVVSACRGGVVGAPETFRLNGLWRTLWPTGSAGATADPSIELMGAVIVSAACNGSGLADCDLPRVAARRPFFARFDARGVGSSASHSNAW